MLLTKSQRDFLMDEFRLSESDVLDLGQAEIRDLREKCFDIEVDEVMKSMNVDSDDSQRCETATALVDLLFDRLRMLSAQRTA